MSAYWFWKSHKIIEASEDNKIIANHDPPEIIFLVVLIIIVIIGVALWYQSH